MKIKEFIQSWKSLLKSKSIVILKCPYCDSLDLTYYKDTLEEEKCNFDGVEDVQIIKYKVSCNKCHGLCIVKECWGK